jgi:PPIC-type PPIASE domain
MILDSKTDNQHDNTDATPDSNSDTHAAESATPVTTTEADTTEPIEAAAAETHDADADTEAEATVGEGETADAAASHEAAAVAEDGATVSSATAAPRTSMPTKAIAAVLLLAFAAAAFILIQRASSKPVSYNLSKHDMEVVFQEMVPPPQQSQIASSPEEKKRLLDEVRKLLSVAAFAESEGYAQRPEVQSQLALQNDISMNEAYRKKHPDVQVSDDDVNAYYQAHPSEFDTFLQNNPRFQQQAAGPNRDNLKKEYGKLKVVADLARKEKLDEDETVRLPMLIKRSDVLQNAYLNDLDKNADKLVSDAEIDQYYSEHPTEFEEVRVRHILINTQPQPPGPDAAKKGEQPKPPSKEEARKKAEEALAKARKGEDFAALVKQYSEDPGSKDKGGEYTFGHGQMVPEFEKAAFALQPGQISDLVETQFGYHIIKLEERHGGSGASDQKTRQQIISKLKKDKIEARIEEIAKSSKVSVPDDFDANVKAAETPQLPAGHPAVPNDQQ